MERCSVGANDSVSAEEPVRKEPGAHRALTLSIPIPESRSPNPDPADAASKGAASATTIAMRKSTAAVLALVFCLLTVGGLSTTASAQVPDSVRQAALRDFHGDDLTGKDGPLAKAGMDLLLLYHARASADLGASRTPADPSAPSGGNGGAGALEGMQVGDGRVAVEASAAGDPETLVQDLTGLGATRVQHAGSLVSAHLPISRIPDFARLASLNQARPVQASTGSSMGRSTGASTGAAAGAPGEASPSPPPSVQESAPEPPSSPDPASSTDAPSAPEPPPEPAAAPEMPSSAASPSQNDRIGATAPSSDRPVAESTAASDFTSSGSSNDAGAFLLVVLAVAIVLFLDP